MRILLVSSSSGSRGGGEIFLLYLAQALQSAGHTVAWWASDHPRMDEISRRFAGIAEILRERYANTYDLWHRGLLGRIGSGKTSRRLAKSWSAWRPDVIHVNKQNLEDGNDLLVAAMNAGTPHLCTIHITQSARFLGARFAAWRDREARRCLEGYTGPLVAVAPTRAAELAEFVPAKRRIRSILNGVPSHPESTQPQAALRAREDLPAGVLAVVAVGRLEPQKNPLGFLRYAARIREVAPTAQLRWIGSGRMTEEWEREMTLHRLEGTVRRINWRDDVRSALPAFDLFLHTAAFEGLPLAILEAMDAGLPCLVEETVRAQLPVALQRCVVGIDENTNWKSLLADRATLRELGQRGRSVVREEFSTAAMARAYLSLYEEICAVR